MGSPSGLFFVWSFQANTSHPERERRNRALFVHLSSTTKPLWSSRWRLATNPAPARWSWDLAPLLSAGTLDATRSPGNRIASLSRGFRVPTPRSTVFKASLVRSKRVWVWGYLRVLFCTDGSVLSITCCIFAVGFPRCEGHILIDSSSHPSSTIDIGLVVKTRQSSQLTHS